MWYCFHSEKWLKIRVLQTFSFFRKFFIEDGHFDTKYNLRLPYLRKQSSLQSHSRDLHQIFYGQIFTHYLTADIYTPDNYTHGRSTHQSDRNEKKNFLKSEKKSNHQIVCLFATVKFKINYHNTSKNQHLWTLNTWKFLSQNCVSFKWIFFPIIMPR